MTLGGGRDSLAFTHPPCRRIAAEVANNLDRCSKSFGPRRCANNLQFVENISVQAIGDHRTVYCPISQFRSEDRDVAYGWNSSDFYLAAKSSNGSGITVHARKPADSTWGVLVASAIMMADGPGISYSLCPAKFTVAQSGYMVVQPELCSPVDSSITIRLQLAGGPVFNGISAVFNDRY